MPSRAMRRRRPCQALEGGEGAVLGEGVEAGGEERVEGIGGTAVEQVADAVVGGDALDAEQGLAVGAGLLVLHAALEGEEGGILHEEGSECTGGGVSDRELLVGAAPGIGEGGGGLAEAGEEGIEGEGIESRGHIPSFKGAAAKSRAQKPCSRSSPPKRPSALKKPVENRCPETVLSIQAAKTAVGAQKTQIENCWSRRNPTP